MIEVISKYKLNVKILINTIFIILSIILPQMFHLLGGAGPMFLPMHIPVILAGITLGPIYGLLTGLVSPVISTFLTGMPAVMPVMPMMICQLAAIGLAAGVLYKCIKLPSILMVLVIQISGMIFYGVAYEIIKNLFLPTIPTGLSAINAYITGTPGIILQIVFITGILEILKKKGLNDD